MKMPPPETVEPWKTFSLKITSFTDPTIGTYTGAAITPGLREQPLQPSPALAGCPQEISGFATASQTVMILDVTALLNGPLEIHLAALILSGWGLHH